MNLGKLNFKSGVLLVAAFFCLSQSRLVAQETAIDSRWYTSLGLGGVVFEGDQPVKDAFMGTLRLGFDYSDWWTFEGSLAIAPKLDENFRYSYGKKISRLYEQAGVHDTFMVSPAFDVLFHFTRWERVDPYLTCGIGATIFGDEIDGDQFNLDVRAGGGVMYHFNDEWAVRVDCRTYLSGADTEANLSYDAGVVWNWGAGVAPNITAVSGIVDSDGDRLSDSREGQLGTDPYNADTDGDGLTDGEEVLDYNTDPLKPDTDYDGLKDGEEVKTYQTDPNKRDTDDGGVADGHEVLDDNTDPLNPADDLRLFELYIPFDYDKAVIKPGYFGKLDIIVKVLSRNPAATAVIEGHADRKAGSDKKYNQKLSEKRARAVLNYLVSKGIAKSRLKAIGYGFSRPKAPNDPKKGNPINRRVEVYIRGLSGEDKNAAPAVADKDEVVVPAAPVSEPEKVSEPVVNPEDK